MPIRRSVRKVGRRRYAGIRKRVGLKPLLGLRQTSIRVASRKIHYFKRYATPIVLTNTLNSPNWTTDNSFNTSLNYADDFGTWQTGGAFRFMLSSTQENADLAALYDRYKITGVKLKFLFQQNVSGTRQPLPLINYSFDGDDATAPTSRNQIQVKQYCKERVLNGNRSFSVFIKPRISKLIYAGPVTSAYSSEKPVWLDMGNKDCEHYGLKLWLNNWFSDSDTSSMKLTIQPIYYVACRDTQ